MQACMNWFYNHIHSWLTTAMRESHDSGETMLIGDHPSIEAIKRHMSHVDNFDFKEVSQNEVRTLLKGLNPKKSPGYDHVPPKLLTIAAEEMSIPLTPLINGSIKTASFPDQLKLAELSPLFKNSDSLLTGNYRPVSVLTCISKVFEKVYHDQLYEYFK